MNSTPSLPGLIVIDVQRAFDIWDASGARRNQPDAIHRIVTAAEVIAALG
jgi:hypothetical protein